ncbi:MAG: AtpZ/AtpI family protein [Firmicutes bacterium]|nr:AtpZ/AtpI family protein [Bacillota bacterium]MBQ9604805.1 AtpZ/AtpI family protein [Bacillota bacterium]
MKDIGRALGLITQVGISMLVPILLCLCVGAFLDRLFGTSPVLMFIFIVLGVAAGFRSVYMLVAQDVNQKDDPYYWKKDKNQNQQNQKED